MIIQWPNSTINSNKNDIDNNKQPMDLETTTNFVIHVVLTNIFDRHANTVVLFATFANEQIDYQYNYRLHQLSPYKLILMILPSNSTLTHLIQLLV
jgi:hypothetical protein